MTLKIREMQIIFDKLDVAPINCKHHVRGYIKYHDRILFPLFFSFGRGDLPQIVFEKIARTMHLTKDELTQLARCKISKQEYFARLINEGIIQ